MALPDLQKDLGIREDEIGTFMAIARLGAVAAIPFAIIADRKGRQRLLVAMIIGFTICTVGSAVATDWRLFAAFQFAGRAFTAADEILSVIIVLEQMEARQRGWAVGILSLFGALGDGLATALYPLSSMLPGSWRALYLLAVVPLFFIAFLRRNIGETRIFAALPTSRSNGETTLFSMISNKREGWGLAGVTIAYFIPISAALALMPKYLRDDLGYSPGGVSLLLLTTGVFALSGNLVGGALSDHIGRRRSFALSCLMMTIGFGTFYLGPAQGIIAAWLLASFAFMASHAIFLAIPGEMFPTISRTTAATTALAVGAMATSIGLFVEGRLFSLTRSHSLAIGVLLPSLLIAALLALYVLPETAEKDLSNS
jgi:MFS family permease